MTTKGELAGAYVDSPVKRQRRHLARDVFMRYQGSMKDPKFFKFFQSKDCFKPRKSYDDIDDPRIVECLKDEQFIEVMKDPEIAASWQRKETWDFMDGVQEKMEGFFRD